MRSDHFPESPPKGLEAGFEPLEQLTQEERAGDLLAGSPIAIEPEQVGLIARHRQSTTDRGRDLLEELAGAARIGRTGRVVSDTVELRCREDERNGPIWRVKRRAREELLDVGS